MRSLSRDDLMETGFDVVGFEEGLANALEVMQAFQIKTEKKPVEVVSFRQSPNKVLVLGPFVIQVMR